MTTPTGPLAGIRVLDAACILAAPTAATLLSEYGAEVIKVEQPGKGDMLRRLPPFRDDVSMLWKVIARNRQSVSLDFRTEKGREVLKQLAGHCDVITLNYRPETLTKWGLDFKDLLKYRKDLIVFHVTAFGRTGPYADRPGFARVGEAFAGLTYRTGYPDRPPVQAGYPMLGDGITGLYGAFAIMLALRERDRTGEPQLIDLGLYEPVLRLLEDQIISYDEDGMLMERIGNSNPTISPNGLFPTRDGRFVSIPASTDQIWRRVVALIGDDSLLKYDTNTIRVVHREEIEGKVANWTKTHDLMDLVELCGQAGIACGPVYSTAEIVKDPHIAARGSIITVDDPETGKPVRMPSSAGRFSTFSGETRSVGPKLGEHTDTILANMLGYSPAQISALREEGII